MAAIRAVTTSTSTPEPRAISSNGSRTKPSILSSETARILALIGSLCSTGSMGINPTLKLDCPTRGEKSYTLNSLADFVSAYAGYDGGKVTTRAAENEQVPDKMRIAKALVQKK